MQIPSNNGMTCFTCSKDHPPNATKTACVLKCDDDEIKSPTGTVCVKCGNGYKPDKDQTKCDLDCAPNYRVSYDGAKCIKCPGSKVRLEDNTCGPAPPPDDTAGN